MGKLIDEFSNNYVEDAGEGIDQFWIECAEHFERQLIRNKEEKEKLLTIFKGIAKQELYGEMDNYEHFDFYYGYDLLVENARDLVQWFSSTKEII